MPQIGPAEILVVLLVALLVFGPHKLPEVGRQVGRGLHELRKFQDTVKGELDDVLHMHEHEDQPAALPDVPPPAGADDGASVPGSVTSEALPPAPHSGARAPSRFRAPGTPPTV